MRDERDDPYAHWGETRDTMRLKAVDYFERLLKADRESRNFPQDGSKGQAEAYHHALLLALRDKPQSRADALRRIETLAEWVQADRRRQKNVRNVPCVNCHRPRGTASMVCVHCGEHPDRQKVELPPAQFLHGGGVA
jgi:hypothetical protein